MPTKPRNHPCPKCDTGERYLLKRRNSRTTMKMSSYCRRCQSKYYKDKRDAKKQPKKEIIPIEPSEIEWGEIRIKGKSFKAMVCEVKHALITNPLSCLKRANKEKMIYISNKISDNILDETCLECGVAAYFKQEGI